MFRIQKGLTVASCCAAAIAAGLVVTVIASPNQTQAAVLEPRSAIGTRLKAPSATEPKIGSIPTIADAAAIKLPSDAFIENAAQYHTVLQAEHKLLQSCVASYGLSDAVPQWTDDAAPASQHDRLFGVIDSGSAANYGYHTAEESDSAGAGESLPAPTYASAFMTVYMGDASGTTINGRSVPVGGCALQARQALDDSPSPQDTADDLTNYGLDMSNTDSRVLTGFRAWSACMASHGYSYVSPMAAINDPRWGSQYATPEEIKVATADVQCKSKTNLTGLRVAVATAYQTAYLAAHPGLSTTVETKMSHQKSLAATIVR